MENNICIFSLSGTIIFLKDNINSKSEAFLPYIYSSMTEVRRVLFENDNPFENNYLHQFDGKKVDVLAYQASSGTYIIKSISETIKKES